MIKRINKIKNFGVFENFRRTGDIRDFEEKNIIYGWNYSGKTTLSRLISYLDKNVEIEEEYKDIEFEVELDNGERINQTNRASSPLKIEVFNSDFIKENLHFELEDKKIQGIKFAVGDTGNILDEIKNIDEYIKKANFIIARNKIYTRQFEVLTNKFTDVARQISEILNLGRSFTRTNIVNYIQQWTSIPLESLIITDDELHEVVTNATAQNIGNRISLAQPTTLFASLVNQVSAILKRAPIPSTDDELLSSDEDLYRWAKFGLDIYNQRTHLQRCAFCGGQITAEGRLKELNSFYSNEAAKLKEDIDNLKNKIEDEIKRFENLEWSQKSENDLALSCQNAYRQKKNEYSSLFEAYKSVLILLISKLDDKYFNSLFISVEFVDIDVTASANLENWLLEVKKLFEQSNRIIDNFNTTQAEAKEIYKKHLVAQFLINEDYRETERKKDVEDKWIQLIQQAIQVKDNKKKELRSQLDSIDKGKDEMNNFIRLFLNRDDLTINVTDDDYFILYRSNKIATHLSDGEKTAIAFSHFMVTLKSLKDENKLQDYIVFIDDPISSLDANHIAQVCNLINTFFFEKGLDTTNRDKVCNCFKQLFIATHNFELFSFLKDANNLNRRKKVVINEDKKEVPSCNYYMIKKLDKKRSTIIDIPKSLSKYKSEYVYLFSEIDKFKNDAYPDDRAYMMPNIVRRFLEIYTLMKLPGNTDEIDNRIRILFSERISELKILHNFSHFSSFERITRHSELILRMQDIIDDIYAILDADPQHFQSLKEGIKKDKI